MGFVAIASRHGESLAQVREAAVDRGLTFPILHSSDASAAVRYYAEQTPRAYLVDTEMRLLYRGAIDNFKYPHDPEHQGYLEGAIRCYLAGAPIERPETASFGCAVRTIYYDIPKPLS